MGKTVFFEITVNNEVMKLIRVDEGANLDLTISLHNKVNVGLIGGVVSLDDPKSEEHRISVHSGLNSSAGINTIKRTFRMSDGKKYAQYLHTKCLKESNSFQLLALNTCPYLRPHRVQTKTRGEHISLGSYHPENFRLAYALAVAKSGSAIQISNSFMSCRIVDFGLFSVAIIWSFLSIASNDTGTMINYGSSALQLIDDQHPPERTEDALVDGLNPGQLEEMFLQYLQGYREYARNNPGQLGWFTPPGSQEAIAFCKDGLLSDYLLGMLRLLQHQKRTS